MLVQKVVQKCITYSRAWRTLRTNFTILSSSSLKTKMEGFQMDRHGYSDWPESIVKNTKEQNIGFLQQRRWVPWLLSHQAFQPHPSHKKIKEGTQRTYISGTVLRSSKSITTSVTMICFFFLDHTHSSSLWSRKSHDSRLTSCSNRARRSGTSILSRGSLWRWNNFTLRTKSPWWFDKNNSAEQKPTEAPSLPSGPGLPGLPVIPYKANVWNQMRWQCGERLAQSYLYRDLSVP